ncbi:MAG: folate-binding protein YgfZ [Gammaproteobacteria bacterium]
MSIKQLLNLKQKNLQCLLPQLGVLAFTGNDAKKFLQGQTTCNLDNADIHHSKLGAFCTIQGRMVASFRVFLLMPDVIYLIIPKKMIPIATDHLKNYMLFSDVVMEDISNRWQFHGVYTENEKLFYKYFKLIENKHNAIYSKHSEYLFVMPSYIYKRYLVMTPTHQSSAILADTELTFDEGSPEEWALIDILAGNPIIEPATSKIFVPQHINYDRVGGVDYDKGCYLGQEIIARLHYRGSSKYTTCPLHVESTSPLQAGQQLLNQQSIAVARIVNTVKCGNNQYAVLVMLKEDDLPLTELFTEAKQPIKILEN